MPYLRQSDPNLHDLHDIVIREKKSNWHISDGKFLTWFFKNFGYHYF